MKKAGIIGSLLVSTALLAAGTAKAEEVSSNASSSSTTVTTDSSNQTGTTDSSSQTTVTDIQSVDKKVTLTNKTMFYADETLTDGTEVNAGTVYQTIASCKINGESYYQVSRQGKSGYIKASDAKDLKKVTIKQKLLSGAKEWSYYKNFDWDKKGAINKGSTYTTDGYYELGNGERYYSISRQKDGKLTWYGYVNIKAMQDLTFHKKDMMASVKKVYKRYQNLYFENRGTTKVGENFHVKGYYQTGSGTRYYSLYKTNNAGKEGWYGYINADALQQLTLHKENKKVTATGNYKTYSNFFWKERSKDNKGRNYFVSGYYTLGNGKKYYSLYQTDSKGKNQWRGYMNADGLKELKGKDDYYKMKVTKKGTTSKYYNKVVTAKYSYKTGNGNVYYSIYDGKTWLGYVNSKALTNQYYSSNPKIIRVKKNADLYKDANRKTKAGTAKKDEFFKVDKFIHNKGQVPLLKLSNGRYITANKAYVAKTNGYQNPKQYYQVSYSQIKPYGTVGYNLNLNYEGVKTYMVMKKLGTYNGYNCYNTATKNAVRNFQRNHGLKATGIVDKQTWVKLGFSEQLWTSIDSYVAPLKAFAWDGRQKHIEAMINQAYKYLGNKYLEGASSSPSYGVDCSGLVMQSLYAGGLNVAPISSINHASPGNEYNSRNLWASDKLKRVPYSDRQRGDLIFYYQPGTTTIYHVAIYLGNDQVIESWPPKVTVWPIKNSQRWVVAGVKRPFI